jgi:hypothetical protein
VERDGKSLLEWIRIHSLRGLPGLAGPELGFLRTSTASVLRNDACLRLPARNKILVIRAYRHDFSRLWKASGYQSHIDGENANNQQGVSEFSAGSSVPTTDANIHQMMMRLQELETQNITLRSAAAAATLNDPNRRSIVKVQVFHCMSEDDDDDDDSYASDADNYYLGMPSWNIYDGDAVLRSHLPVADPDEYVEKQGDVSFVVYKYYDAQSQRSELDHAIRTVKPLPDPRPTRQNILLISNEMITAMRSLFDLDPAFYDEFPALANQPMLKSPYIWWYPYRKVLNVDLLVNREAQLVDKLPDWIEATYSPLHEKIDDQFGRGRTSPMFMQYLIRPG